MNGSSGHLVVFAVIPARIAVRGKLQPVSSVVVLSRWMPDQVRHDRLFKVVIPAKAGIQCRCFESLDAGSSPA
jgi:hypothetical protein